MSSGDARRSFHFWNDRVMRAERGRLRNPPGEFRTDDALYRNCLADADLAASVMNGQASAYAGSRRRTINLAFGEDADVAAVALRVRGRAGENHAVKKAQILFKRMRYGAVRRHHPEPRGCTTSPFSIQVGVRWLTPSSA